MTNLTRRGFLGRALAGVAAAGLGLGLTPKPREGVEASELDRVEGYTAHKWGTWTHTRATYTFTQNELRDEIAGVYSIPRFINEGQPTWAETKRAMARPLEPMTEARLERLMHGTWAGVRARFEGDL